MAKFSQLLPWLRQLFPAASQPGLQPSEVSEDVSLVHEVYQGTDFLTEVIEEAVTSAAGVAFIVTRDVPAGFYWYVLACHLFTDDPTGRFGGIFISGATDHGIAGEPTGAISAGEILSVPRSFIVPPNHRISASLNAITAGDTVSLHALLYEIRLGLPPPPSP